MREYLSAKTVRGRLTIGVRDCKLLGSLFRPICHERPVMYAIIEDSGTQFKVTAGDTIRIDRPLEDHEKFIEAKTLKFDRVLLVGGDGTTKVGQPLVDGATVEGLVLESVKADKVIIEKYNRRKRYHRRKGHRQKYLTVKIASINA